jgi:hypothetical protein
MRKKPKGSPLAAPHRLAKWFMAGSRSDRLREDDRIGRDADDLAINRVGEIAGLDERSTLAGPLPA